jgi:mycothiol synthase
LRTVPGMELRRRALTLADAPGLAELMAAVEAADRTGEHYSTEDLAEELGWDMVDLDRGTLAIVDGSRVLAYGLIMSPAAGRADLHGVVHPEARGRGLGRELMAWSLDRAAELWGRPLELRTMVTDGNPGQERLLRRCGFADVRTFHDMECPLPHPTEVRVPAGLRLAPYDPDRDEELRQTRNIAFAEHWGSVERTPQQWQDLFVGTRVFRPKGTWLLLDAEDRVAAYLISHEHGDPDELHVPNVGTLPAWRGRGAAGALLAHTLNTAGELGYRRVTLSVDSGNATGALGVYQRAGFTVRRRHRSFALDLR